MASADSAGEVRPCYRVEIPLQAFVCAGQCYVEPHVCVTCVCVCVCVSGSVAIRSYTYDACHDRCALRLQVTDWHCDGRSRDRRNANAFI